ncbi:unnamed protein product [Effrenium voratum]|nr:unnamed protein product [Effrenium voratum]
MFHNFSLPWICFARGCFAREVPPPPGQEGPRNWRGRMVRGIRFLVAPNSGGPLPSFNFPALRCTANAREVMRLAKALVNERLVRSRHVPVIVEASCSRQHAYVLCKALAKAQQLTMMRSSTPEAMFSCVARVTADGPRSEEQIQKKVIRVLAWPPFSVSGELAERAAPKKPIPCRLGHTQHQAFSTPGLLVVALVPVAAKARRSARRATGSTSMGTEIWSLLGLKGTATKAEIKQRFKSFVRTNHPDVKGDRSPAAIKRWTAITEAYREIMKVSDDLFWVEGWVARVQQIEYAKLQNADRLRRERMEQRAARAGMSLNDFEEAQIAASKAAKEIALDEEENRSQFMLESLSVGLSFVLLFLFVSVIAILVHSPNSK